MRQRSYGAAAGLALLLLATPAGAVITRLTALQDMLTEATFVVTARVETLDATRPAMVLTLDEALKGKPTWKRLPVLLKGDNRAVKLKESPELLRRLARELPLVLFVNQREGDYAAFACTDGTWFSLTGTTVDGEVRWALTHLEPYLRRTYSGTTVALVQALRDALAGKAKLPAPDSRVKPGLGPEVKKTGALRPLVPRQDGEAHAANNDIFHIDHTIDLAVIPTVLVGGPLAMLALLFPAVFGGWKRWLVLLSTGGTISTLYFCQWWFAESLAGSWWGTPAALWTAITLATVVGLAWAWNRHLFRVQIGEAPLLAGRIELVILLVLSVLGVGLVAGCTWLQQPLLSMAWLPAVAFVVAVWCGTLYVGWTWLRGARLIPALATEAVVLLALALVCVALMPALPGRTAAGGLESGEPAARAGRNVELRWSFRLPDKGAIASSPLVLGDRVYVAAAHDSVFRPYGAVYCLAKDSGKVIWTFHDGKKMKQVFSSPVVVGDRLYIGEGFHQDADCKVYCLDVARGTKVWEHQTGSHTESTPFVSDGRVYVGGGDDGLYALDAATGARLWNYPGYHIDAGAVVAGDRVYVGCGIGDTYRTTMLFCLDAAKGQPRWRVATDLPVWSRPIVSGGFVFAGIGNGRLNEADDRPAGGILCVRAADGSEVWKQKLPDGVLGPLGADRRHLYFGCRDGSVYCLHRHDGALAWRRDLGSPVVAGPALDVAARLESLASRLYAVSIGGQLVCLEPATGQLLWSKDLVERTRVPVEVIATPALEPTYDAGGREGWRLYVGLTMVGAARIGELHCYQEAAAETSQP